MPRRPIRAQDLSPADVRALYELILERMEISSHDDRHRWERKVHRWRQSVGKNRFHATVRELVES